MPKIWDVQFPITDTLFLLSWQRILSIIKLLLISIYTALQMNIKLKLAIISSIVAIVVAVIQFGPGWFSSLGTDGLQSPKQEINNRGVSVGGDFTQIQSMVISKDLQNAEAIIIQRNWQDAERDPAFRRFVRSRYQKDIEDLNTAEKATFWQDMQ